MISVIEAGPTARKILRQQPLAGSDLGLPSVAPALGRPRLDQGELFATGPPGDHSQVPPPDELDQRTTYDDAA